MTDSRTYVEKSAPPTLYGLPQKINPRTQTLITKACAYELNQLVFVRPPEMPHEHLAFQHV